MQNRGDGINSGKRKFSGTHLYPWWRKALGELSVLPKNTKKMFLARVQTRTPHSGVKHNNSLCG